MRVELVDFQFVIIDLVLDFFDPVVGFEFGLLEECLHILHDLILAPLQLTHKEL